MSRKFSNLCNFRVRNFASKKVPDACCIYMNKGEPTQVKPVAKKRKNKKQKKKQKRSAADSSNSVQRVRDKFATITEAASNKKLKNSEYISSNLEVVQKRKSAATQQSNNKKIKYGDLMLEIDDPSTAIVQNHVTVEEAKMLVKSKNGQQRLLTFGIPEDPCTVQDLLESVTSKQLYFFF